MKIVSFSPSEWDIKTIEFIENVIRECLLYKERCSVFLTGGVTAKNLYKTWSEIFTEHDKANVDFFISDERCVPVDDPHSNYGMIARTLFNQKDIKKYSIHPMFLSGNDWAYFAECYEEILPAEIDLMLFSIGNDGHFASLFPGEMALRERQKKVVVVESPNGMYKRLTITPSVVFRANHIIVFARGENKFQYSNEAVDYNLDSEVYPSRLLMNATWITDVC